MDFFFTAKNKLPPGLGMAHLGPGHLLWLGAAVLVCLGFCLLCRRLSGPGQLRLRRGVGLTLLASEALRETLLLWGGTPLIDVLPLHLCSLTVFVILWHCLRPGPLAGELLYSLGLPGGLCALLWPDWLAYPAWNLLSINSFLAHILLTAYPLLLVSSGALRPDWRRLPKCFLCLAGAALPVFVLNRLTGANYFFLNWPSAGSPLEPLEALLGRPGYVLGYLPLIALVWAVLYLPFRRSSPEALSGSAG